MLGKRKMSCRGLEEEIREDKTFPFLALPAELRDQCIKWLDLFDRCQLRGTCRLLKEQVNSTRHRARVDSFVWNPKMNIPSSLLPHRMDRIEITIRKKHFFVLQEDPIIHAIHATRLNLDYPDSSKHLADMEFITSLNIKADNLHVQGNPDDDKPELSAEVLQSIIDCTHPKVITLHRLLCGYENIRLSQGSRMNVNGPFKWPKDNQIAWWPEMDIDNIDAWDEEYTNKLIDGHAEELEDAHLWSRVNSNCVWRLLWSENIHDDSEFGAVNGPPQMDCQGTRCYSLEMPTKMIYIAVGGDQVHIENARRYDDWKQFVYCYVRFYDKDEPSSLED